MMMMMMIIIIITIMSDSLFTYCPAQQGKGTLTSWVLSGGGTRRARMNLLSW